MKLFGRDNFEVMVGVCAMREIKLYTLESLLALQNCPNPKIHYKILMGDALISRSRSLVATHFLQQTHCDVLFFLDDDVRISSLDATSLMWAAVQHKLDIVGAIYPTKSKGSPGMVMTPLEYGTNVPFGKNGGFLEVRHIGNGCMAVRREVLQAMVDHGVPFCRHGERKYWPFFQHKWEMIDGSPIDLSEDYYFAEEARKLGFKIWADTRIKLYHEGSYLYSWDDVLETKRGQRKQYNDLSFNIADANKISLPENGERPEGVKAAEGAANG